MSQPRRLRSHDAATGTGPGESEITRAHPQIGLFVQVGSAFDPANDTLELRVEVSPDNDVFAPVDNASPAASDVLFVTGADLTPTQDENSNTVYAAYTSYHNAPVEHARVNIVTHSGGFEVTTDLYLSGWTQRGASFNYLTESTV